MKEAASPPPAKWGDLLCGEAGLAPSELLHLLRDVVVVALTATDWPENNEKKIKK